MFFFIPPLISFSRHLSFLGHDLPRRPDFFFRGLRNTLHSFVNRLFDLFCAILERKKAFFVTGTDGFRRYAGLKFKILVEEGLF